MGLGLVRVSSAKRVPLPAASITAFTLISLLRSTTDGAIPPNQSDRSVAAMVPDDRRQYFGSNN